MNEIYKIDFYDIEKSLFYWSPFAIENAKNNGLKWLNNDKNIIWSKIFEPILFSKDVTKIWKEWFFDSNNITLQKKVISLYKNLNNKDKIDIINIISMIIWKKKIGKLSFFIDQLFLDYPFYDFVLRKYIEFISRPLIESRSSFESYYPIIFYQWNDFISKQNYDKIYEEISLKIKSQNQNQNNNFYDEYNNYDNLINYEFEITSKYGFLNKRLTLTFIKEDLIIKLSSKKNTNEYKKFVQWYNQMHDQFLQFKSNSIINNNDKIYINDKNNYDPIFILMNDPEDVKETEANEINKEKVGFKDYFIIQETNLDLNELNKIEKLTENIKQEINKIRNITNTNYKKDKILIQNNKFFIQEQKWFLLDYYNSIKDITYGKWKCDQFIDYLMWVEYKLFIEQNELEWNQNEFENKINEILNIWIKENSLNELKNLLEVYSEQKELLVDYNYNFFILKDELNNLTQEKLKERIIKINNSLNAFYLFYYLYHKIIEINNDKTINIQENVGRISEINNDNNRIFNDVYNGSIIRLELGRLEISRIIFQNKNFNNLDDFVKELKNNYDNINYDKKYIVSDFERFFRFIYNKNKRPLSKLLLWSSFNDNDDNGNNDKISFHLFLKELILQELWISKNIILSNYEEKDLNDFVNDEINIRLKQDDFYVLDDYVGEAIIFYQDFWTLMQEEKGEFIKNNARDIDNNELNHELMNIESLINASKNIYQLVKSYNQNKWIESNNMKNMTKYNSRDEFIWNYLFENVKNSLLTFLIKQKSIQDKLEKIKISFDNYKNLWKPSFEIKINRNNFVDKQIEWLDKITKSNERFNDYYSKELAIMFKIEIELEFGRLRKINDKVEEYQDEYERNKNWERYLNDLDYQLYQIPKNLFISKSN